MKPPRRISELALEKLQELEGSFLSVYRDDEGLPTIGVGHRLTRSELTSGKISIGLEMIDYDCGLSDDEITALLKHDLLLSELAVESGVKVSVSQPQFDALVLFTFNVGVNAFIHSTLRRLLNKGEYGSVPDEMRRWVWIGGETGERLRNRREQEIEFWSS